MKKLLITSIIISLFAGIPAGAVELFNSAEDLENFEQKFYEAPISPMPDVTTTSEYDYHKFSPDAKRPLFKKVRIKLTNMYRVRAHKWEQKQIERDRIRAEKQAKKDAEKYDLSGISEYIEIEDEVKENSVKETVNKEVSADSSVKPIALSGDVKKVVVPKDLQLDCDKMVYNEETDEIVATGHATLYLPAQKISLKAEKFIYNQAANILKAYDKVVLKKDGKVMKGDYMQVNLNEETATIEKLSSEFPLMKVEAESATTESDVLTLKKGRIFSDKSHRLFLRTKMAGPRLDQMMINEEDKSFIQPVAGESGTFKIDAAEIFVDADKTHNKITLKDADVYYKGRELFTIPSLTAFTNKNNEYFQANYPELGSIPRLGLFAGPGVVFSTPFDSTIKLIPIVNYKDKLGAGGIARYRSATNMTDIAYGSSKDLWVVRGRQRLDDNLFLQYGVNSYLDSWFIGGRMAKYAIEAVYDDRKTYKNFLGEGRDMRFRHRAGAGYMHDSDINRNGEKIKSSMIGTTRFKYMAEIDQSLYRYVDKKNLRMFDFGIKMQGSAALYGTGDTQFIARIGPRIRTQNKYWMQDLGYFLSGYEDNSPVPRFDTFRYGHSNVYLREAFRVNKYFTVAWSSSMNLSNDAPNDKVFQENAFIFAFGPDEFKLSLGYDFIRRRTYFSVLIDMDTKGSAVKFDKMEIKNPDRLTANKEENEELITFEKNVKAKPKQLQYATVIEFEDPSKEQL